MSKIKALITGAGGFIVSLLFSGGQKELIGISRALCKEVDIIILDGVTSALDNKTEAAVIDIIKSIDKNIFIFMMARRFTTSKYCDQITELQDGIINPIDPYNEVMSL